MTERPWEASAVASTKPTKVTVGSLTYTPPSDELFDRADQGTSPFPQDRARQRHVEFDDDVAHLIETAGPYLTGADLDRYVGAWSAWLAACGSCVSTMVTGRSNFNVRRAQKASASADKRLEEVITLKKRFLNRAARDRKEANVDAAGGPIAVLRQEIEDATARLDMMKTANRIVRSKPKNERTDGKIASLMAAGVGPAVAESLFVKDFTGGYGYPSFELTSARTAIKRKEQRIVELERRDESADREDMIHTFSGITVTLCFNDDRIRIRHDTIPAKDVRQSLKSSGWRWSRREGAWQRQLTRNAVLSAEALLGVEIGCSL
jgi:hypothetical protein